MKHLFKVLTLFSVVSVVLMVSSCPHKSEPEPPKPEVIAVTGVSLSQSELTLNVNESVALNATVSPENASNKNVSWSSSDETVATVDTNGVVKALKEGTATITVKTEDGGKTATCTVTVTKKTTASAPDANGFVTISAGSMPLDSDGSYHVTLTKAYMICDHEVTQKEWQDVMGNNPSHFQGEEVEKKVAEGETQENRPVECVSWYDAIAYCNKRSIKEGLTPCYSVKVSGMEVDWANLKYADIPTSENFFWKKAVCDFSKTGYRLPTEAEWEIAARGGVVGDCYAGTDDVNKLGDYAWYKNNSNDKTHEVKKKLPNGYGLYDMSGNVWEWCWDWYGSYAASATDPTDAASGSGGRVSRGSGWNRIASICRASFRGAETPNYRRSHSGFRLVRSIQ